MNTIRTAVVNRHVWITLQYNRVAQESFDDMTLVNDSSSCKIYLTGIDKDQGFLNWGGGAPFFGCV